jgi:phosphoglycolate phosphatase-like HAD superfamily hydrolase
MAFRGHKSLGKIMDATEWIRSRAANGQPLNLHAVMRERPDLLEQAFAGPSPLGWRRTLIQAGVDPYKIVHEYEDQVRCAICGYSSSVLGTHLKGRHGVTGEEYIEEFGTECELSSEWFRATRFGSRPIAGIPHWEGLWSRYYVIDWIIRLHEEGRDLNFHSFCKVGGTLSKTGWKLFGSWDSALRAAGLNPDDERAIPPFQQWTGELIIERLRDYAVEKRKDWRLRMSNELRMAIGRIFGSPEAAARAAGLRFADISNRAIISGRQMRELVAALRKLEGLEGLTRRRKLSEIYHKNEQNRRIIQNRYGSLQRLAEQEGINPQAVAIQTYRDKSDVHHDMDMLEQSGLPLCFDTLRRGHKRLYNVIMDTGWGRERLETPQRQGKSASRPRVGADRKKG